jgi:ribosomal protein S21
MLRRFSRKVLQSGLIIRGKKAQYYQKDKSRALRRKAAVQRSRIRSKNDFLRKIGKLEDVPQHGRPSHVSRKK